MERRTAASIFPFLGSYPLGRHGRAKTRPPRDTLRRVADRPNSHRLSPRRKLGPKSPLAQTDGSAPAFAGVTPWWATGPRPPTRSFPRKPEPLFAMSAVRFLPCAQHGGGGPAKPVEGAATSTESRPAPIRRGACKVQGANPSIPSPLRAPRHKSIHAPSTTRIFPSSPPRRTGPVKRTGRGDR